MQYNEFSQGLTGTSIALVLKIVKCLELRRNTLRSRETDKREERRENVEAELVNRIPLI